MKKYKVYIKNYTLKYVVWGGFSVNNATLNRFFSLHFVLPFVIATLALLHLVSLHDTAGSGNPSGLSSVYDKTAFSPYYIFKDLITIFMYMGVLSIFVFFFPNVLGDSENYVMANPMQTPPAIVPEWYLLPYYAVLRSIPNKLLGVIAMFSAILIILTMTAGDLAKLRGIQFRPYSKIIFFGFAGILLLLLVLGAKHVESPYIEIGQAATLAYFVYFLYLVPSNSLFEFNLNNFYLGAKKNFDDFYNSLDSTVASIVPGFLYKLQSIPLPGELNTKYQKFLPSPVKAHPSLSLPLQSMPVLAALCSECESNARQVWLLKSSFGQQWANCYMELRLGVVDAMSITERARAIADSSFNRTIERMGDYSERTGSLERIDPETYRQLRDLQDTKNRYKNSLISQRPYIFLKNTVETINSENLTKQVENYIKGNQKITDSFEQRSVVIMTRIKQVTGINSNTIDPNSVD